MTMNVSKLVLPAQLPYTALAPMQNVTTLGFMRLLGKYGAPDLLFTEYFRVHVHSHLEAPIVESIRHHNTGKPIFAQLIGENLSDIQRTIAAIQEQALPVAGIDLNMGCPAPKIYKKNVGGGLLRDPDKVDTLLGCMRAAITGPFTVKMRIGFEDTRHFERILDLLEAHQVDLLSLHARTVKEGYRSAVHYEYIQRAVQRLNIPVLANGNITSAAKAHSVFQQTGCAGLMVGRSCIRNPWIFKQIAQKFAGETPYQPTFAAVRGYIDALIEMTQATAISELGHINHLKKFLNFVGLGVDPDGQFLHAMRRVKTRDELLQLCDTALLDNGKADQLYPDEPLKGLVARPNCETSQGCSL